MRLLNFFLAFVSTILIFYILIVGKDLLIPFFLAVILWYLINILANAFQKIHIYKFRLPMWLAFVLSFITMSGLVAFFVNLISNNIADVVVVAPAYQKKLTSIIAQGYHLFNLQEPPTIRQLIGTIDIAGLLSQFAVTITGFVSKAGIILIYLIFLFLEQKSFSLKLGALIKQPNRRQEIFQLLKRIDRDIQIFIGIKTFDSALTAIVAYLIMASQGLDFAEFWAILIFTLNFIPSIGSIVSTIFPSVFAIIQYEKVYPILIVAGGIGILQFLIGNILEPRLMGNNLNLSPIVIILSLFLWGALWGIAGMILCVPITVILMIILSHFEKTRPIAILLSRDGNITE